MHRYHLSESQSSIYILLASRELPKRFLQHETGFRENCMKRNFFRRSVEDRLHDKSLSSIRYFNGCPLMWAPTHPPTL